MGASSVHNLSHAIVSTARIPPAVCYRLLSVDHSESCQSLLSTWLSAEYSSFPPCCSLLFQEHLSAAFMLLFFISRRRLRGNSLLFPCLGCPDRLVHNLGGSAAPVVLVNPASWTSALPGHVADRDLHHVQRRPNLAAQAATLA